MLVQCPHCGHTLASADAVACPACSRALRGVATAHDFTPGPDPNGTVADKAATQGPSDEQKWFYVHNQEEVGPVPWEELQQLVDSGVIRDHDRVRPASKQNYVSAAAAGLKPSTEAPPTAATRPDQAPPPRATPREAARLPQVDGYEILQVLGRGGMGVVYKARHLKLKRVVALKMIRSASHAGPEELKRFRLEAEAVARLQHLNLVQIYEVGEQDGLPFFSLEYVEGGSLSRRLDGTPMTPAPAAQLVETLARAMHYAHQRGVVHRDLKPANVLMTAADEPKVTDFGLAKQLDEDAGQTRTGAVMGTPSYMAPEQAAGRTHEIGPLCDVYALGAILYECLTGRAPFKGTTMHDTLDQVRTREPVPPSSLLHKTPRDLETICLKCLEKEPKRRYADAAELADDLRAFQEEQPIKARPVGRLERAVKWARRRPAVAAAVSLGVTLFLGVFALVVLESVRANVEEKREKERRRTAEQREQEAHDARLLAEREKSRANEKEEDAQIARKNAEIQKTIAEGKRQEAVTANMVAERLAEEEKKAREREADERLKAETARSIAEAAQFRAEGARREAEAASYDARRALASSRVAQAQAARLSRNVPLANDLLDSCSPEVRFWDWHYLKRACGGGRVTLYDLGDTAAFSPDGRWLASAHGPEVHLLDLTKGLAATVLKGHAGRITALAFSPNGKLLLSAGTDATARVWDVEKAQLALAFTEHQKAVLDVAFSPDGKQAATAAADGNVLVWDPATGKTAVTLSGHVTIASRVAWAGDGKKLVTAAPGEVRVYELPETKPVRTIKPAVRAVDALAVSPDGRRVAVASDTTLKVHELATGDEKLSFVGHTKRILSVAFAPDGRRLVSGSTDGTMRFWRLDVGKEETVWPITPPSWLRLAYSPDGRFLAGATVGALDLWDTAGGPDVLHIRPPGGPSWGAAFTPDGRTLVSGGNDSGAVSLYDARTGRHLRTLLGQTGHVHCVVCSSDGKYIASGSMYDNATRGEVKVWDARTGKKLLDLDGPSGAVGCLAFTADGKWLAAGGGAGLRGEVVIWEAATGKPLQRFDTGPEQVRRMAFSPDGKRLSTAGLSSHYLDVWDTETGKATVSIPAHKGAVTSVAYSPDGKWVATGGSPGPEDDRGEVKIWDRRTVQAIRVLRSPGKGAWHLTFSPDGQLLAAGSVDGAVQVWDVANGQEVLTFAPSQMTIQGLAFSPDGLRLAAATQDGLFVWDGTPTRELLLVKAPGGSSTAWTATNPDGRFVATRGEDRVVRSWDTRTGKQVFSLRQEGLTSPRVAFHFDRRLLAYAAGKTVKVVDLSDGHTVYTFDKHDSLVWTLAISGDGKTLATVCGGTTKEDPVVVTRWSLDTGRALGEPFKGEHRLSEGLAFDTDLTHVAAVDRTTLRWTVWELTSGRNVGIDPKFVAQREVVWSSEGRVAQTDRVGYGYADATRVLDARVGDEDRAARTELFRPDGGWHQSEARLSTREAQWPAAVFHLERFRATRDARNLDAKARAEDDFLLSAVYHNFGTSLTDYNRYREGDRSFRKALEILDRLADADGAPALYQRDRANTTLAIAGNLQHMGVPEEARKFARRGAELFDKVAADNPNNLRLQTDAINAHDRLAGIYKEQRRFKEAEAEYKEALARVEQALKKWPRDLYLKFNVSAVHHNYGAMLGMTEREDESEAELRKALALLEECVQQAPANLMYRRDLASTTHALAERQADNGQLRDAEAATKRSIRMLEQLHREAPDFPQYEQELARAHNHLGVFLERFGRHEEAEEEFEAGLEIGRKLLAAHPDGILYRYELSVQYHNFGASLLAAGRPRGAEKLIRQALDVLVKLTEEYPEVEYYVRDRANTRMSLGRALTEQRRVTEALPLFAKAQADWELLKEKYPESPEHPLGVLNARGEELLARNDHAGVLRICAEKLELKPAQWDFAFSAARLAARDCRAAERDTTLTEERRKAAAGAAAEKAVEYLRETMRRGGRAYEVARQDIDLEPLRQRDDFQKLLKEWEEKVKRRK